MPVIYYLSHKENELTSGLNEWKLIYSGSSVGTPSPLPRMLLGQVSTEGHPSVKIASLDTSSGAILGLTYDPFSTKPYNWRFKDDSVIEVKVRVSFHDPLVDSEYEERVRHKVTEIPHRPASLSKALADQRAKNQAAISLLQNWLADESGYDEAVWPRVKRAIEEHRLSERSRFND